MFKILIKKKKKKKKTMLNFLDEFFNCCHIVRFYYFLFRIYLVPNFILNLILFKYFDIL